MTISRPGTRRHDLASLPPADSLTAHRISHRDTPRLNENLESVCIRPLKTHKWKRLLLLKKTDRRNHLVARAGAAAPGKPAAAAHGQLARNLPIPI